MSTRCKWCGDVTDTVHKQLCKRCKDMSTDYCYRIGRMFHTTPSSVLLSFRNICMDMQEFRRRGGKDLPGDLDYQLERVNRYLEDKQ